MSSYLLEEASRGTYTQWILILIALVIVIGILLTPNSNTLEKIIIETNSVEYSLEKEEVVKDSTVNLGG